MKLRWLTCLLCLVIFAACVDSIPDPPAVNPHATDICASFSPDFHGHAKIGNQQPHFVNEVVCYPTRWSHLHPSVKNITVPYHQPQFYESTDSSPPAARNAVRVLFA